MESLLLVIFPRRLPLNNVITIDDERIKSHLDRVVRGTVEAR